MTLEELNDRLETLDMLLEKEGFFKRAFRGATKVAGKVLTKMSGGSEVTKVITRVQEVLKQDAAELDEMLKAGVDPHSVTQFFKDVGKYSADVHEMLTDLSAEAKKRGIKLDTLPEFKAFRIEGAGIAIHTTLDSKAPWFIKGTGKTGFMTMASRLIRIGKQMEQKTTGNPEDEPLPSYE